MKKLQFPETVLPGLFFNDFINNQPLLPIYSQHAFWVNKTAEKIVIRMDEEETIYIDPHNKTPQWVAYEISHKASILEMNWAINWKMTCELKTRRTHIYVHPSGFYLSVCRNENGSYTYLLCKAVENT